MKSEEGGMLGHDSLYVESAYVFRCVDSCLSPITDDFLDHLAFYIGRRYQAIVALRSILGERFIDFLHVFAGMDIDIPNSSTHQVKYTLLPEMVEFLGPAVMTEILAVFGGSTLKVIPHKLLVSSLRDVDIYYQISKAKSNCNKDRTKALVRRLSAHYGLTNIWWIYNKTSKVFGNG